jgi:DNA-binding CsgD family transcriptional regulator
MVETETVRSHRGNPPDFRSNIGCRDCQALRRRCIDRRGRTTLTPPVQTAPEFRDHRAAPVPVHDSLLERHKELATIESALARARDGRGSFVVVEGPAGIGKTALLAAARTAAVDEGMRVLRSRGTELEREFPFGVVRQLFEPLLADLPEAHRADLLQGGSGPAAGLLGLLGAPPVDGERRSDVDRSFAILHGLYWLSANLSGAQPLCVVVDDAHWADLPSLRYLVFLLTRLEGLNIAVVCAARPREAGTNAELVATLTTDPSAELVRLPPLTRTAVAQLVESRLEGVPDPLFVTACMRATRGMPFLMHELVEALAEGRIAPTAEAARHVERIGGRSVGRSIRLRLRRLPEHAGRLARALAVLEQSGLHEASQLAGLADAEGAEAAELLVAAGILEPGRPLAFIHPIVRSGIYSDLASSERAHDHARAARILAELPGTNERVAKHLLASEPAGDAWLVDRLREAARAAICHGAPESASLFLRRALQEPPSQDDRSPLLLELGVAEASAGLDGWSEHLQGAVEAAPDPEAAARAARVLARALNLAQRYEEAVEVLDRAAAALDGRDPEFALELEAGAVIAGLNDPATAPSMGFRRAALRERVADDREAPAELLGVAAFIAVLGNEAEVGSDLATRALLADETTQPGWDAQPSFSSATFARATLALLWAERYGQVGPLLDASITEARVNGDGGLLAVCLASRGWLALRRGDLRAAEGDAQTALAGTELPVPPMYRALNGGVLVKALVDQGRLDDADRALAALGTDADSGFVAAAILRLSRGGLRVAQARVAEGLADFLAVGEILTRAMITSPAFLPWRSEAALAHLALGDHESAERLSAEELELARAFGTPRVIGVASRAAGIVAGGNRGEELLRAAIDAFERADAKLDRARALVDLGAMLRRRNRRAQAREFLREALDSAHRAGAMRLAEQAETELRATGARPRHVVLTGVDSLTASELRIAELASQGRTNREIAQTLFVTARTVEGHLTSVFRKLRVQSRDALPAALTSGAQVSA